MAMRETLQPPTRPLNVGTTFVIVWPEEVGRLVFGNDRPGCRCTTEVREMRAKSGHRRWIAMVLAAWAAPLWAQDKTTGEDPRSQKPVTKAIRGQVVDEAGKPVVGITLATHWIRQEDQPARGVEGVTKTDDHGRFRIE